MTNMEKRDLQIIKKEASMKAGIIIATTLVRWYDIPYEILGFYLSKFRKLILFPTYVVNMCYLDSNVTWEWNSKEKSCGSCYLHRSEGV